MRVKQGNKARERGREGGTEGQGEEEGGWRAQYSDPGERGFERNKITIKSSQGEQRESKEGTGEDSETGGEREKEKATRQGRRSEKQESLE